MIRTIIFVSQRRLSVVKLSDCVMRRLSLHPGAITRGQSF
jgi:hypothetical protein